MYSEEVRCGVMRASMRTNCLLTKPELGKVKTPTVVLPPPSHTYGIKSVTNNEGAREVTMIWKEHEPNPDAKPGPDFEAMNKRATISGITHSKDIRAFRSEHPMILKRSVCGQRPPSGSHLKNRTFGMQSRYRSAEKIRNFGEEEPVMRHVIQGAFQHDWIREAEQKDHLQRKLRMERGAMSTKASEGHARGAQLFSQTLDRSTSERRQELFKMKKFKNVPSRIKDCCATAQQPIA